MTEKEKRVGVERAIKHMCAYGECDGCGFFNPDDTTDGRYWCGIRDAEGNVPYHEVWDMHTAMS